MRVIVDAQTRYPIVQHVHRACFPIPDLRIRCSTLEAESNSSEGISPANAEETVSIPATIHHLSRPHLQTRTTLICLRNAIRLRYEGDIGFGLNIKYLRSIFIAPRYKGKRIGDDRNRTFVFMNDHILVRKPAFLVYDKLTFQTTTHKQLIFRRWIKPKRLHRNRKQGEDTRTAVVYLCGRRLLSESDCTYTKPSSPAEAIVFPALSIDIALIFPMCCLNILNNLFLLLKRSIFPEFVPKAVYLSCIAIAE